ncbi:SURF1 family protein [Collimonas pratensis]|uniref:SURF1 family protein n=1 Tax=Collimonas pratensis TaxID=279113 RepID=UPI00143CF137|nr:SURF1 family protein [Collimonas pratensis]NKI72212.1 SURF1 family protein [Collimonas pratensis]
MKAEPPVPQSAANQNAAPATAPRSRSSAAKITLLACAVLLFAGFFALGSWQLKRLQWKLDLIQRVDARVHAPAVKAPGPQQWPHITAESDEYRHVSVSGNYLYALTTRVQAATELGGGYWLLTPLRSADGSTVLVNRGFVPTATPESVVVVAESAPVVVNGLLRISEPGGGFLRHNDPAGNRWYSRDVQAIAAARGLDRVAPYFVDAEAVRQPAAQEIGDGLRPVAGLTVIAFHNSHLVYALTWYALALMVAGACYWVVREERKLPRKDGNTTGNAAGKDQSESEDGKQN